MAIKVTKEVSKASILAIKSDKELWDYYFKVDFKNTFRSPIREDRDPTCSMHRHKNTGEWWMKDHNGSFHGNVFDALMVAFNLGFYDVLKKIAKDLKINGTANISPTNFFNTSDVVDAPRAKKRIEIEVREWEQYDLDFWKQFGVTLKILKFFRVYPVQYVYMNSDEDPDILSIKFTNSNKSPIYAYRFGKGDYKIYMPLSKLRFITNSVAVQGLAQLPEKGDLLIITKSMKDIMTLRRCGYYAIAVQAEGHSFPLELFQDLQKRFKRIVIWYDNDYDKKRNTGRICGKKIADQLGIEQIEIADKYECKDPSDFSKKYNIVNTQKLIKHLIK